MKYSLAAIIFLSIFMVNSFAEAKGTFMVQPTYDEKTKKQIPMIGLGIYEKLIGNVAFNSWTGAGGLPDQDMTQGMVSNEAWWMTTRNQIDFNLQKLTISPGFQLLKTTDEKDWSRRVYIRFSAQLW